MEQEDIVEWLLALLRSDDGAFGHELSWKIEHGIIYFRIGN